MGGLLGKKNKVNINTGAGTQNNNNVYNFNGNYGTKFIQKGNNNIMNINNYAAAPTDNSDYITDITFAVGKTFDDCRKKLENNQYYIINTDIRANGKKKYCVLGYKKNRGEEPITNIVGIFSNNEFYDPIIYKSCQYKKIIDLEKNSGDINRGSGGNYLYLYYTTDKKAGLPIRGIRPLICEDKWKTKNEDFIQNAQESLTSGNLDVNYSRGGTYNYIKLCR